MDTNPKKPIITTKGNALILYLTRKNVANATAVPNMSER